MMNHQSALALVVIGSMILLAVESKTLDPYKVLGVERNASQRDIQKAFHKLSLQYHPDKNKNNGAQEKFAEINNAYDILSDEQKRKNYDLHGDEKGSPGFDPGDPGAHGGYSYSTGGGPGQSGFSFRPGEWQNMGEHGGAQSFSFSFGGPGSGKQSSYGFGMYDIFSNFFGGSMGGESQFGGFSGSSRSKYGSTGFKSIPSVSSQFYRKEIIDKGMTWLLLFYTPYSQGIQYYESIIEEATSTLKGAVKVGSINCESEFSLCTELGAHPRRGPRIFLYSYPSKEKGSLVEYDGDLDGRSLKSFCQDNLPRLSKRINLEKLNFAPDVGRLPKVLLLSSKKSTSAIWRAVSGLYGRRFTFYDAEVHHVSDPSAKRLGVDSLPAIIGWLPNGEKRILKSGISVKDLKSAIEDLSGLLDNFEKLSKKVASARNEEPKSEGKGIPLLASSNFDDICGDKVPVCLIGVFRNSKTREKLEKILLSVSQKSFSRWQRSSSASSDSVSYALLDASKHQSFLNALSKSSFKSSEKLLVAYKPKRGTYAAWEGDVTEEAAEGFISTILNGDVQFAKTRQKPSIR